MQELLLVQGETHDDVCSDFRFHIESESIYHTGIQIALQGDNLFPKRGKGLSIHKGCHFFEITSSSQKDCAMAAMLIVV
jgi:hypothetical protein